MLAWWRRRNRRRQLSPVVVELPRLLAHRYGGKDWYSPRQVERALDDLRRRPPLEPFAYAVACDAEAFGLAQPGEPPERRRALRREIAELFALDDADLALRKLRQANIRTAFRTADTDAWKQLGDHGGRSHADGSPD